MGRQITIIATDVDLANLEAALQKRGDVEFLSDSVSKDGTLLPLASIVIPVSKAGENSLFCFLAPRHLERKITVKKISDVKTSVNVDASNLVDFWRPYFDGHILRPGRMYFQNRLLRNGVWIPKDPEFCKWADGILAIAKKVLKKAPDVGGYIGQDAEKRLNRKVIEIASL